MATSDRAKPLLEMGEDPIVVRSGPEPLLEPAPSSPAPRPLMVMKLEPSAPSAGEKRSYGSGDALLALGGEDTPARSRTPAAARDETTRSESARAPTSAAGVGSAPKPAHPPRPASARTPAAVHAPAAAKSSSPDEALARSAPVSTPTPRTTIAAPIPGAPVLPSIERKPGPGSGASSPTAQALVSPVFDEPTPAKPGLGASVTVTKVLEEDPPAPVVPASEAAQRLQGAFAKLPSLEPKPAPLPPHVDTSAKPTHTFGASALRDAVSSLEQEGGLETVVSASMPEPAAELASPAAPATDSPWGSIDWNEAPAAPSEALAATPPAASRASRSRGEGQPRWAIAAVAAVLLCAGLGWRAMSSSGREVEQSALPPPQEPTLVLEAGPAPEPDAEAVDALVETEVAPAALDGGDLQGFDAEEIEVLEATEEDADSAHESEASPDPKRRPASEASPGEVAVERDGPPTEEQRRELRRAIMQKLSVKAHAKAIELGQIYELDFVFDWELHIKLAHAARLHGEVGLALRWFTEFAERYPENMYINDAAFWVAQIRWKIDGLSAAVSDLEAVSQDPSKGWSAAAQAQLRRLLRKQADNE